MTVYRCPKCNHKFYAYGKRLALHDPETKKSILPMETPKKRNLTTADIENIAREVATILRTKI